MYQSKTHVIGKLGTIRTGTGLTIDVAILDHKRSYGRDRYEVKPMAGSGKAWVESVVVNETGVEA